VLRLAKDYLRLRYCVVEHFLIELIVLIALGSRSHDTEVGLSPATKAGPSPSAEAELSLVSALAKDYIVVDLYELE